MKKDPAGVDVAKYGAVYARALLRDSTFPASLPPDLVFDPHYSQLSQAHKRCIQRAVSAIAKALLNDNGYDAEHISQ